MRHYCTYFDRNYLGRGLALIESLARHEADDWRLFVICMDEVTRLMLRQAAPARVVAVPFHEIEGRDEPLLRTKAERSLIEYYWTATPTVILRLLERHPDIDVLTYLDADLYFFSSPQPLFTELGERSILVHGHRFSAAHTWLQDTNGKYNVGLVSFRNDEIGRRALGWWRDRCLEWCSATYRDGKLGDQMYLNDWPQRFPAVRELEHIGAGVGPWNNDQYAIALDPHGSVTVDGRPLIFYHFHAMTPLGPGLALPVKHPHYRLTVQTLRCVYVPYLRALERAAGVIHGIDPRFTSGLVAQETLTERHILLANRGHADTIAAQRLPHARIQLDAEWDAYCPQPEVGESRQGNQPRERTVAPTTGEGVGTPRPATRVAERRSRSQHDLLDELHDTPLAGDIRVLYVIGAHRFQEREVLTRLLPNLAAIYLFEPIPQLVAELKRLTANDPRVTVLPYAVSDQDGVAPFHLTNNDGESSSLLPLGKHRDIFPQVRDVGRIQVDTRRLDTAIRTHRLPNPDMLLIDVQGAEYRVLSSLPASLRSTTRLIYVEASLEEVYVGARSLDELKAMLEPSHRFVGYAPLADHCPTHGNALFVRHADAARLTRLGTAAPAAPRISVIVSAYESEAFMWECLEDLEGQTIADQLEIIVVDAASPQNERSVVEAFQQRYRNIHYLRTPERIGVYAAWNLALKLAQGRYVTPFSTNDRLRKDAYAILADALDAHPDVALVYGDTYLTHVPHETFERHTRAGEWRWPEYSYDDLLRNCRVGPHPMWRRSIHDAIGYFDESYRALGDQEFWLRMGDAHRLLHIPEVTGLYWHSPDGLSNRLDLARPEEHRIRQLYQSRLAARRSGTPERPLASNEQLAAQVQPPLDCSIIIPVCNKMALTEQCLRALAQATADVAYEVIIVDNGSTDGTSEFVRSLDGDVQIIRNDTNLGFAKACNQGARAARGKHLVFLNNDTIPQAGWLRALVEEVDSDPEVAIVGSKLLYPDRTVQHAGVAINRHDLIPYHLYRGFAEAHPAVNSRRELQAVTASCVLIRRRAFDQAGGFDDGYRNGFEDIDLCLTVREQKGRVVYQPKSVLIHLESQTPGRKQHDADNVQRFLQRWGHAWWLADEDVHYHTDGYKLTAGEHDTAYATRLQLMGDIKDRAAWAHVAAAQAAAVKQDWAGVRRELRLHADWPNDRFVLSWGATVAGQLEETEARIQFLSRYLALSDAPAERLALARTLLERRDFQGAEEHLRVFLASSPHDSEGLLVNAVLYMQREQYLEAERSFSAALRAGADRRKCLMGMGMAALGRAYAQGAWERFLQVLDEHPDDAEAVHWLLRSGTAQNRWADLAERLEQYLSRNPGDLAARFAYAGVLVRDERLDAARRELEALRALAPAYDGLDELAQAVARKEAAAVIETAQP